MSRLSVDMVSRQEHSMVTTKSPNYHKYKYTSHTTHLKDADRLVISKSEIRSEELLTPALCCHKDTAQMRPFLFVFMAQGIRHIGIWVPVIDSFRA